MEKKRKWREWFASRRVWFGVASALWFVYGIPGYIEDGKTWQAWIKGVVMPGDAWPDLHGVALVLAVLCLVGALIPEAWISRLSPRRRVDPPPPRPVPRSHQERPYFTATTWLCPQTDWELGNPDLYAFEVSVASLRKLAYNLVMNLWLLSPPVSPDQPPLVYRAFAPSSDGIMGTNCEVVDVPLSRLTPRLFVLVTLEYTNKKNTKRFWQRLHFTLCWNEQQSIVVDSAEEEKAKMDAFLKQHDPTPPTSYG